MAKQEKKCSKLSCVDLSRVSGEKAKCILMFLVCCNVDNWKVVLHKRKQATMTMTGSDSLYIFKRCCHCPLDTGLAQLAIQLNQSLEHIIRHSHTHFSRSVTWQDVCMTRKHDENDIERKCNQRAVQETRYKNNYFPKRDSYKSDMMSGTVWDMICIGKTWHNNNNAHQYKQLQ